MTFPAFVFGFLVATLLGAAFHLWRGGGLGRLLLYLILAWLGFLAGQGLAGHFAWTFARVGPLHLGAAVAGSLLFLGAGHWLSLIEVDAGEGSGRA